MINQIFWTAIVAMLSVSTLLSAIVAYRLIGKRNSRRISRGGEQPVVRQWQPPTIPSGKQEICAVCIHTWGSPKNALDAIGRCRLCNSPICNQHTWPHKQECYSGCVVEHYNG